MSNPDSSMTRTPTMVSAAEAFRIVCDAAKPLPPKRVPLLDAVGLTLSEPIHADRDYPPFRRAMMDGFAVKLASAGRTVAIAGQLPAGHPAATQQVTEEACVEIMTGAACPPGTEAVVQKEHVRRDGDRVVLPATIEPGGHIAEPGSDCPKGTQVISAGSLLTPMAVAVLASVGSREVAVIPSPRMAVIVTGEELVADARPLLDGQIRDSNGPMLAALAIEFGLAMPQRRLVGDDRQAIRAALDEAGECDLVVLSGGASVGAFDFVPDVLVQWGAEILFRKVAQKPGKPLLLARRGRSLVFALPGNPLACHFCFCRYIVAAIAGMSGRPVEASATDGRLLAPLKPDRARARFVPSVARWSASATDWTIQPLRGASSADIFHAHAANAYVELPPGSEELPAGAVLPFRFLKSCV